MALPTARIARPSLTSSPSELCPFLAPSIQCTRNAPYSPVARFSTSPALWKRDNNKNRGVSILRHTGPRKRQTLSVKKYINDLPKPVSRASLTPLQGDEDHGLWGFFRDKQLLHKPADESHHGRAWTVAELRKRNWPDLHSLWWVCVKERNRLATAKIEQTRQKVFGDQENRTRDETVQETMKAILDTLLERHNAWEEAHRLASADPTIDLTRTDGPQLVMETYDTDELDAPEAVVEGNEKPSRELPKQDFFNTQDHPKTLKDKVKEKAQKILWNK